MPLVAHVLVHVAVWEPDARAGTALAKRLQFLLSPDNAQGYQNMGVAYARKSVAIHQVLTIRENPRK